MTEETIEITSLDKKETGTYKRAKSEAARKHYAEYQRQFRKGRYHIISVYFKTGNAEDEELLALLKEKYPNRANNGGIDLLKFIKDNRECLK